jgi:putative radical SAM enzyme (TIGR03279 family)
LETAVEDNADLNRDLLMYEFAVAPAVTQLRRRGVEITDVAPESLAAELELEAGDRIIKVNGRVVRDYLDFRFQTGGETELILEVRKRSGEEWELDIERDEGEDFGLGFEQIVPRQCANECIFCFCKGNPETARPSLFIRDEDIRLSFLYGNYTTLTSITEDEMRRIIEQRLTPQYVSVHATDLDVRAHLLGVDRKRADIFGKMQRMLDADIEIHAQVVLCPEINDGEILKRTVRDLAGLHPKVKSVAIVPLGLTRYNTDERLQPVTPEFCRRTISEIIPLQREFRKTLGTTFAFLGDEIYLRAGMSIPTRRHYGDYPQIEDGIGMVRSFSNDFQKLLGKLQRHPPENPARLHGTIMTGTLFAPVLKDLVDHMNANFGTRLSVVGVENRYFGGDVSVAGLLTAECYLAARSSVRGKFVIIPGASLKSGEAVMLDGTTLEEFERQIALPVHALDLASFTQMIASGH